MQVGATIYSLMGMLREDYFGTLEKLAATGCKYIEYVTTPANEQGVPVAAPAEIGRRVKEMGLTPISSHVHFTSDPENMKQVIAENIEMGAPRLVLPFELMNTADEVKALAQTCNKMGELCKENGLEFYYHNHFQEFVEIDGHPALDLFLAETDPALVQFQMDAYWVKRAGHDPIAMLDKLGSRCTMIHQKDLSAQADPVNLYEVLTPPITDAAFRELRAKGAIKNGDFVTVGQGILDVDGIVNKAKELGYAKYIIVELDNINNVEAVEQSIRYLEKLV
ncbi:MAG: sugar phosphate isomerase/epimerase [Eubacteriales bacterium]|nr:sugar phosphate isomerase/epimerase [Eubacteriales bacterium]